MTFPTHLMHIRTKWRIVLSLGALSCAAGVLGTSLFAAHMVSAGFTGSVRQELTFGEEILPGHVFYPAVMALDRVQLELTPQSERVLLEVEYAHRRLSYATRLLEQNRTEVALTTITKAEKYLQEASRAAIAQGVPKPVKQHLVRSLEYHQKLIQEISPSFSDSERAVLDKISAENQTALTALQVSI